VEEEEEEVVGRNIPRVQSTSTVAAMVGILKTSTITLITVGRLVVEKVDGIWVTVLNGRHSCPDVFPLVITIIMTRGHTACVSTPTMIGSSFP
jgi:hypothetical protein